MRMDRSQPSAVVAIECVAGGSSSASEWSGDTLQTGDVLEEIKIGSSPAVRSPFKGGKSGVHKILHAAFKRGDTSIKVRVRRGSAAAEFVDLQACIVPHESAGRKQYVLRSIHDPNYAVGLVDRMESECIALQGSRSSRIVCALSKAQLQDGYVSYPWEKKMRESLPIPKSSSFLSMLILPKTSDPAAYSYNSLEDTLARANSWLISSQASGVPIVFMNVQTEALLTKGFIYISSVIDEEDNGAASTRSGLRALYKEAERASKLLVISRVSNEKILPWMVSSSGAIRCFDTVSLSHKLSLHRHALQPIRIHVLMWEQPQSSLMTGVVQSRDPSHSSLLLPTLPPAERRQNLVYGDTSGAALGRDTAGDVSLRFHDFSFPNSWV